LQKSPKIKRLGASSHKFLAVWPIAPNRRHGV